MKPRPRASNDAEVGQRLYNYYDCKWGHVVRIYGDDGWFEFHHEDGTRTQLNGVRVSTNDPKENP